MKRLAFAVCTLALLSACGERGGTTSQTGQKPAADTAQVHADQAAAHEAAGAAIDEAKQARDEAAAEKGAGARMEQYKRSVLPDELDSALEIFSTGNYGKVTPCVRFENRTLAVGPMATLAHERYTAFTASS